jgi:hypothetical protein
MSGENSINSDNFMLGVNPNKNIKPSNSLLNHLKELEKSNIAKINGTNNKILKINNFPPESSEKVFTELIDKLEGDVFSLNNQIKNFNKEKKNIIDLSNKEKEKLKEIIRTLYASVLTITKSISMNPTNRVDLLERLRKTIQNNKGLLKNIDEIMLKKNTQNMKNIVPYENNKNRIKISNIIKNLEVKSNKPNTPSVTVINELPVTTEINFNKSVNKNPNLIIQEVPINNSFNPPLQEELVMNKNINKLNDYYNNLKNNTSRRFNNEQSSNENNKSKGFNNRESLNEPVSPRRFNNEELSNENNVSRGFNNRTQRLNKNNASRGFNNRTQRLNENNASRGFNNKQRLNENNASRGFNNKQRLNENNASRGFNNEQRLNENNASRGFNNRTQRLNENNASRGFNNEQRVNENNASRGFNNRTQRLNEPVSPRRFNNEELSNENNASRGFNNRTQRLNENNASIGFNNEQSLNENNTSMHFNNEQSLNETILPSYSNNREQHLNENNSYNIKNNSSIITQVNNNSPQAGPINEKKIQKKIFNKINNTKITNENAKKKLNNYFL